MESNTDGFEYGLLMENEPKGPLAEQGTITEIVSPNSIRWLFFCVEVLGALTARIFISRRDRRSLISLISTDWSDAYQVEGRCIA
jgi:hypothetical protein